MSCFHKGHSTARPLLLKSAVSPRALTRLRASRKDDRQLVDDALTSGLADLPEPSGRWNAFPSTSKLLKPSPTYPEHYQSLKALEDDGSTFSTPGKGHRGRRVFTFRNWITHRETSRYFRHVTGILSSATFTALTAPLLFFTANAACIAMYEWCAENDLLPANFPLPRLDESPITLTSFALSLLLVFRTDASYARWNEALSAWSDVRNTAKEIGRSGSIWVKAPALQQLLRRWTIAFPRALQVYLREHGDIQSELSGVLLPHELDKLTNAHNYPHYVLHVLTEVVGRAGLSEIRQDILLNSISNFGKAIGVCEKIIRYPIPLSYSRHTSRFMTIWLALLPLSLWPTCKWAMVPITGFVAFLLLGIEEIGVQIEEPFWLLPLEDFCVDIERDISAIMQSKDSVMDLVSSSVTPCVSHSSPAWTPAATPEASAVAAAPSSPVVHPAAASTIAAAVHDYGDSPTTNGASVVGSSNGSDTTAENGAVGRKAALAALQLPRGNGVPDVDSTRGPLAQASWDFDE